MDIRMLAVYFVLGGVLVSAISYFGSQSKGLVAAFLSFLPTITVLSLCFTYLDGGSEAAVSYAKGMLILLPSWVLYIVGVIFLLPRLGLVGSLSISVAAYVVTALIITKFL